MSPDDFGQSLFLAAQRRRAEGDFAGANVLLEECLRAAPRHIPALAILAEAQLEQNPRAAAELASRLAQAAPQASANWSLLGRAVAALSRPGEALTAFSRAAELAPQDSVAWSNLALAHMRAGDPHASVKAARRAIELKPDRPESYANLGHALNVLRQSREAEEAFAKALGLRPDFPDALLGMATAQKDLGRPSRAIIALLRAREIAPQGQGYALTLASLHEEFADLDNARAVRADAERHTPDLAFASAALMGAQYDPDMEEGAAAEMARAWGRRQMAGAAPIARPAGPKSGKIRIGYVSADLYRHPVGWLGAPAIGAHDRQKFDVAIYANQTCADEVTDGLKLEVDRWVPILGLDDDQVAAQIVADGIDILVDLSGHTAGHRLGVFARRPGPVQISWLGYFATTGLPAMDYMLLDRDLIVPGGEEFFTEKILYFPQSRFCYRAPAYAPTPERKPSDQFVFASFNNSAKINRRVVALWARVLFATPNSLLLLKWRSFADPLLQARFRSDFAALGVDPARLRFDGASEHSHMLAQYNEVDIALDPFPFCGGLTTCEALWMGVPVVTLPGTRPVSRQTHSILRSIGRGEWSAPSMEDYVATASALAADAARRGQLRKSLRAEMARSPLCNAASLAESLQKIFVQIHK